MTTPTTPEQARDFAQSIFDDGAPDDEVELIRSLADQVESLTAERDALKADAERYRWMTTQIVSGDLDVLEKALGELDPEAESVTQEQFDGVIDAALKAVL